MNAETMAPAGPKRVQVTDVRERLATPCDARNRYRPAWKCAREARYVLLVSCPCSHPQVRQLCDDDAQAAFRGQFACRDCRGASCGLGPNGWACRVYVVSVENPASGGAA